MTSTMFHVLDAIVNDIDSEWALYLDWANYLFPVAPPAPMTAGDIALFVETAQTSYDFAQFINSLAYTAFYALLSSDKQSDYLSPGQLTTLVAIALPDVIEELLGLAVISELTEQGTGGRLV